MKIPPPPPLNRQRGFILAAIVALIFVAPGAQAQETVNICGRTQQVVDEILRRTLTEGDTCDNVLVSEMALSSLGDLMSRGIVSLKQGDFGGLTSARTLGLSNNNLTELPAKVFSGLSGLVTLELHSNSLAALNPDAFSGLGSLLILSLNDNQLNELPDGIFRGVRKIIALDLSFNPGAPFRFTLRFEPETLDKDFTAAPVRLVSDKTALLPITVPLSVIGQGGALIGDPPYSLTIPEGSTQSDTVTVVKGQGYFRLVQGEPQLGRLVEYSGIEVVRGPAITFGGIRVKARIFLEGALE